MNNFENISFVAEMCEMDENISFVAEMCEMDELILRTILSLHNSN
jgi:hypothetical protein